VTSLTIELLHDKNTLIYFTRFAELSHVRRLHLREVPLVSGCIASLATMESLDSLILTNINKRKAIKCNLLELVIVHIVSLCPFTDFCVLIDDSNY
jgi:hypothetical protein